MGFPGDDIGANQLTQQWETNQQIQGLPTTDPVVASQPDLRQQEPAPEILGGLHSPPPPGGPQIDSLGVPDYLSNGGSYVPSPETRTLDARTQHHPGGELNLAVAAPERVDLSPGDSKPTMLKCPKCDYKVKASDKKCKNCGHDLTKARAAKFAKLDASADPNKDTGLQLGMRISIHNDRWDDVAIDPNKTATALSALNHGDRLCLPFGIEAQRIDDDGDSLYLVTQGYDGTPYIAKNQETALSQMQVGLAAAKAREDAERKRYAEAPSIAAYSQSQDEHQAVIYQRGLNLSITEEPDDDGLVWKVACKSGTLALSPGPGQTDVETPLVLTADLFNDMKLSFDEKAFPYVTVPETHNNGALENTGYVRKVDVVNRNAFLEDNRLPEKYRPIVEADPEETSYPLSGIEFTEADVKQKALNGSIPDTSIGVKFNYRNKRSGKTYNAAYEHLALTPVPWVDGNIPFGLSQEGVYDFEAVDVPYDGVYTEVDLAVFDESKHKRDLKGRWKSLVGKKITGTKRSAMGPAKIEDAEVLGHDDEKSQVQLRLKDGTEVSWRDDIFNDVKEQPAPGKALSILEGMPEGEHPLQAGPDDDQGYTVVRKGSKFTLKQNGKKIAAGDAAAIASRYTGVKLSQGSPNRTGDTLPPERDRGTMPTTANLSVESETEETHMPRTVEEILAEERAAREADAARIADLEQRLSLSQGTIQSQGQQLHMDSVAKKVSALKDKVPPVLLLAAKRIYEADKPGREADDEGGLNLSVQVPKPGVDGAAPTLEELKLSTPTQIVDYLLSQAPAINGDTAHQIAATFGHLDNLSLSVDPGAETDDEKKLSGVEDWERENHPERFKDNGKGERI